MKRRFGPNCSPRSSSANSLTTGLSVAQSLPDTSNTPATATHATDGSHIISWRGLLLCVLAFCLHSFLNHHSSSGPIPKGEAVARCAEWNDCYKPLLDGVDTLTPHYGGAWLYGGEEREAIQFPGSGPSSAASSSESALYCATCERTFTHARKKHQHVCVRPNRRLVDEHSPELQAVFVARERDATSNILRRLTNLRVDRNMGNAAIGEMKSFTIDILDSVKKSLLQRLQAVSSCGTGFKQAVDAVFNVFNGLETDKQEANAREQLLPMVEPVRRQIGTTRETMEVEGNRTVVKTTPAYIWEVPFEQALAQILRHDPAQLKEILASAARWRDNVKSKKFKKRKATDSRAGTVYGDVEDGEGFEAFIVAVMADAQPGAEPLALILYYDGLEVVNGLGHAKGTHKLGCFYWVLVNIGKDNRMELEQIHLHAVCLEKHVTLFGPEVIISGHPTDNQSDRSSWGFSMRALQKGDIKVSVPDAESETGETVLQFCGGMCLLAADTPAACLLCGFKTTHGPFTKSLCRHCFCDQHHPTNPELHGPYRQATSNLPDGWNVGERTRKFEARTAAKHRKDAAANSKLGKTDAESDRMRKGIVTYTAHAFTRVPYFDVVRGCPHDLMHIVLEGVTRGELGALVYMMTRKFGVPWTAVLKAIADSRKLGCTPPAVNTENMYHGTEAGTPHHDCSFPGTAHQVMEFALCSLHVFEPLIPEECRLHPAWISWKLHFEMLVLLLGSSFTPEQVMQLDAVIYAWMCNFLSIAEYEHIWKPKFHWLSHFPQHIIEWGPPRLYWCMRFEAFNQLVKAIAMASNFKSTLSSVVFGMALREARNLFFHTTVLGLEPVLDNVVEETVQMGGSPLIDQMRASRKVLCSGPVVVQWANGFHIGRFYFNARGYFLARLLDTQAWQLAKCVSIFSINKVIYMEFHLYHDALTQVNLNSWEACPGANSTKLVARHNELLLMCVHASFVSSDVLVISKRL